MTTQSFIYDHPAYLVRQALPGGINTANTSFPAVIVPYAAQAFSATFTITTAGTNAANNIWVINKISGTATTALGTATLGTSVAGTVVNKVLSTANGGAALLQGDQLVATKGTDQVAVSILSYELGVTPLGNVTL